jgi:hypothetical protein
MTDNKLTVAERLHMLETLVNATLWGAYLENPAQRLEIAMHLNIIIWLIHHKLLIKDGI